MDARNAQVGWTDAQWNRVREEVLRAWQSVRVAGSFLPTYGALPRSTQVVPSEIFEEDGTVDERSVSPLVEVSLPVVVTRQQVMEDDLSSALLQFRRRATQVGQLEDWYIFNGTYPGGLDTTSAWAAGPGAAGIQPDRYLPNSPYLKDLIGKWPILKGMPNPITDHRTMTRGLLLRDPGTLGLVCGAREIRYTAGSPDIISWSERGLPDNRGLTSVVVKAMNRLEENGYVGPYACVFGRVPFQAAHEPVDNSVTYPRDRIEPLIGRELLHASALDVVPGPLRGFKAPEALRWQSRGVLVSLTGSAVDLAIAAEATPEFRQVDVEGRYVFSVFERFTLRIKDPKAIVPLAFH